MRTGAWNILLILLYTNPLRLWHKKAYLPFTENEAGYGNLFYSLQWIQCISKADKNHIVCSEKISYFFTSDEYDLYFFTVANRGFSTIWGLLSSGKDLECTVLVWHYATEVRTPNKVNDVTLLRHFWCYVTLMRTRRQSDGSFKRLS